MAKKLTKKQLKENEIKQNELRKLRENYVNAINNFWKDCDTTKNYFKLTEQKDKLDYHGGLKDDEVEKCLRRYTLLDGIKLASQYDKEDPENRIWTILRLIANNNRNLNAKNDYSEYRFSKKITNDDLYMDEILWNTDMCKLLVEWFKKLGFKRMLFMRGRSSGATEECVELMKLGMKVTDFIEIERKERDWDTNETIWKVDEQGLILEFSEDDIND